MTAIPENLPGMSEYVERTVVRPFSGTGSAKKPVVVLGSSTILMSTIFNNGLMQNVYILYRMFQSMGYIPLLLVQDLPESLPPYMADLSLHTIDSFVTSSIRADVYIEIAMSIDIVVKQYLRLGGSRIYKLYLGNILNIDIESPLCYPGMYFVHHYIGDVDDIWVSPHYAQHLQYSKSINRVPLTGKANSIAPYVWDPCILTAGSSRSFRWTPPVKGEEIFLLIEPNISFQKTSLIPLCILESWYRKHRDWKGKIVLVNGNRLEVLPYFMNSLADSFDLVKDGRVEFHGRLSIVELMTAYPSAIPICHQWNNEYNYMVLEYFHCMYPVLHNASDWSAYGYYYPNSDIAAGVSSLERILNDPMNPEVFASHAKALTWNHSPYNPDVQRRWATLLGFGSDSGSASASAEAEAKAEPTAV
jgi:hypothetical protein